MRLELNALTTNLAGAVRREKLEGRDYLVAPVVMLKEGVFAGNQGPLFYNGDVLAEAPSGWDHKPIVLRHPVVNGEHVSACSPDVINRHKIGVILNTKFDRNDSKLRAEAWLDIERLSAIDPATLQSLAANKLTEVSTGLFTAAQELSGTFNGQNYDAVVLSVRPDHLAILPDGVGACSCSQGCGILANEGEDDMNLNDDPGEGLDTPSTAPAVDEENRGIGGGINFGFWNPDFIESADDAEGVSFAGAGFDTDDIVGNEAEEGLVLPSTFQPLAEDRLATVNAAHGSDDPGEEDGLSLPSTRPAATV